MLRRVYCFLLLIWLFGVSAWPSGVLAQAETGSAPPEAPETPIRFERLTQEEGLSQNSVLALLQDREGFLWIGTQDGLNRYDGYNFTVYKNNVDDPESISLASILEITQDRKGDIWVGTWGGGLNRLDPLTGKFTRYQHDPTDPGSLPHDLVPAILEDSRGVLWVGTQGGGLATLDRETGTFTTYRHNPDDPDSLGSNFISTLMEDDAGALWIGTGGFNMDGSGLDRFDPETGKFAHYTHDPADPGSLSSNSVSSLLSAGDGKVWAGTGGYGVDGAGLNLVDPKTGLVTRFVHDERDPASLSSNNVTSLHRDSAGRLWVTTWGGGLEQLQRVGEQVHFTHTHHDPFDPASISTDILWTTLEDRAGVLWIGSINGGLNKLNPQMQRFKLYRNRPNDPNSLSFDVVGGFYEDRDGGLWIGTWGGGLNYFDRTTGKFTHYQHDPGNPDSLTNDTISTVFEDDAGALWVGTFNGLDKLDRTTGKFIHYKHDPADPNTPVHDSIYTIVPVGDGRAWVGTLGGLDLLDPVTGSFTHFVHDPADPGSLPGNEVSEIYTAPSGRLWIGTWHNGMAYLDPDAWAAGEVRFVPYRHDPNDPASLSDDGVWAIHEDRTGAIWAGTQAGLNRLDPATGKFTHFYEKDGLPNNSAICIEQDTEGNLWIATNNGLVRMNPVLMRFRSFDVSHGLQSNEFDSGACMRSANGELYFGGVHGINVFRPEEIRDNSAPPPVAITGFRVFNKPVTVDLTGATPIDLSYQENFISFDFAALDYHAPKQNHYAYKLDGFDDEWVEAGDRRYASYTNLPAGDYVFRVRGSNNDDVWNEAGVALPLRVSPPIWGTWWFRMIGVALLMGAVLGGYGWRVNQIRTQNRRLEQKVTQQTAELRHEIEQRKVVEAALAQKAADDAVIVERTRLARDLHDAVTQTLFSASLIAEVLPDLYAADPEDGAQSAEELRQLTRGALAEMRTLLLELRPAAVTQARLEDLIRQLIEATIGRARVPVQYSAEGQRPLPDDVKVALYRIAQESLNNVIKYAKATQVTVDLRQQPRGVRLSIGDDGVGFDPDAVGPGHLGQKIMRERAEGIGARLAVQSEVGQGTMITVTWVDPAEVQE